MKLFTGVILVAISFTIILATFFPLVTNEIKYNLNQAQGQKTKDLTPLYSDFGIVIPKLEINSKVIKNVNPYDASIYQKALTQGVAHAAGTALPGENGNIFIFSHSSENFYNAIRYNSIFYLLTKLEIGDTITLYYKLNRFDYHVIQKSIIDSGEIKYLTAKTDKPQLTLMTCYPPGTSFKRLIVVAN